MLYHRAGARLILDPRRDDAAAMNITEQLSIAWQQAVIAGTIQSHFRATYDDPSGRWSKGDTIRFALGSSDGIPQFEAVNTRTGLAIEVPNEQRTIGDTGFVCRLNGLRSLRPGGSLQRLGRQPDISAAPEDCRFYCTDPNHDLSLLKRSPMHQVKLGHSTWNAYPNAMPFDETGHFLWVPVGEEGSNAVLPHWPQSLSSRRVAELIELFRRAPGIIIFFNSLHAGASVNHLHAQSLFHRRRLAIEDAESIEYEGFTILDGYPARAFCFASDCDVGAVATTLIRLQGQGTPFNLMMLGQRIVVVPRNPEHEVVAEFPGGVLATMEAAGHIFTADRSAFERIGQKELFSAFGKATLDVRRVIDEWRRA